MLTLGMSANHQHPHPLKPVPNVPPLQRPSPHDPPPGGTARPSRPVRNGPAERRKRSPHGDGIAEALQDRLSLENALLDLRLGAWMAMLDTAWRERSEDSCKCAQQSGLGFLVLPYDSSKRHKEYSS